MAIVKTVNWEGGSNAHYDLNQMTPEERSHFDSDGRPLYAGAPGDGPGQWTPGLPGARGGSGPGDAGGGGGGGGGDLTSSPYYQQYDAQLKALDAADLSGVKSALQQLLIQWGMVPEGFQDKYGALDDTIKQLIQKNTDTGVSQYARLLEQKDDARRAALQNLTARGLGRSGAKGYALRRGSLNFDRSLSDALSGVLGNATQLQSGYAQRALERQNGLAQFLAQLASQWRGSYGGGGGGGGVPAPPAVPQAPPSTFIDPSTDPNPWNVFTGNTIGSGSGGFGTPYAPAAPGQGGGFTSPKKPLLYG